MVDMVKMGTGWFQADSYIPFSFTDSGVGGGKGEKEKGAQFLSLHWNYQVPATRPIIHTHH